MQLKMEKREWIRAQLIGARAELEIAKHHPYFGCDVCGPYGHTFHVCHSTVAKSIKALLYFYDREPEEIYDLKQLVALAAAVAPGFESCMNTVIALNHCGQLTETDFKYKPSEGEFNEAIQLAEELIAFVSAALPEDVR
jgi:HEPN domain-containing protein